MIKIIITDDHPIVRQGIRQIIDDSFDVEVIAEAGDGNELIKLLLTHTPDVILLDISLPGRNGLQVLKEIKNINPKIAVLMFSVHPEDQYAVRSIKLGASGYVTKGINPQDLIKAITTAASGKKFITPAVAEKLAENVDRNIDENSHELLSERELEVLCMFGLGKSIKDISTELNINIKTVSTYKTRILEKLKLKTMGELVRYAVKNNLVD